MTIFRDEILPAKARPFRNPSDIDLSICLVNWNTCAMLRECLGSICSTQEDLNLQIFVVDNASSDGSAEMVRTEFPDVHLIANDRNTGFACATNQGILLSGGRHIFLLNPDTIIFPGTLKRMVDFLDSNPDAGAVAARLYNSDRSLQYSVRRFPTLLTPFTENPTLLNTPFIRSHTIRSRLMNWDHNSIMEVEQPAGAAFMIKRAVIATLGTLDIRYHMFFEDVDLCHRIKWNGWKIYYLPQAEIIHHGGQSVRQREHIGGEFYKSLIHYFRTHYGVWGERKVRATMILGAGLHVFYSILTTPWGFRQSLRIARAALSVFRYGVKPYSSI
jgi:GT2 family glycosyltransferase